MSKTSSSSDTVTVSKTKLTRLIYQYEQAIRDYAYARGVRAGLKRIARFERPEQSCILDFANNADVAEAALYDYIHKRED